MEECIYPERSVSPAVENIIFRHHLFIMRKVSFRHFKENCSSSTELSMVVLQRTRPCRLNDCFRDSRTYNHGFSTLIPSKPCVAMTPAPCQDTFLQPLAFIPCFGLELPSVVLSALVAHHPYCQQSMACCHIAHRLND